MTLTRHQRRALAQDTMRILADGHYTTPSGDRVGVALEAAKQGTILYRPEDALDERATSRRDAHIEVTGESTLAAARRLVREGHRPVALNFASAKNPGGGFLTGAEAQEESIARASGLYACIAESPMYEVHRQKRDAMYTHHLVYSPAVPVFRDDSGALLDEPFECAFITAPAPNAGVVLTRDPSRSAELESAMRERMRRVLVVAARHDHDAIVLGAWGCGVFRNDPHLVAQWFADALAAHCPFAKVAFAVLDRSGRCYAAFCQRFGEGQP